MDASASPVVPLPAVPAVRLVVRTLGGDVLAEPQVELSWSVWELKRALFSAGAPAIARQKLLLEDGVLGLRSFGRKERPLADSETLAAAGLSDGAQLLCLCVPTPEDRRDWRDRRAKAQRASMGEQGRVLTLDPATNSARLHKDEEENSFSFYKVLEQHSELDELGQKLVQNVVEGYSSTVFAFGTTGSGKSSSLWGEKEEEGLALAWGRQLLEPRSARLQPRGARFCCSLLEAARKNLPFQQQSVVEFFCIAQYQGKQLGGVIKTTKRDDNRKSIAYSVKLFAIDKPKVIAVSDVKHAKGAGFEQALRQLQSQAGKLAATPEATQMRNLREAWHDRRPKPLEMLVLPAPAGSTLKL
ncbi:unnamed protein product [Effrenium voratum]|nr:unnamed protein product [Effrenium voratum]